MIIRTLYATVCVNNPKERDEEIRRHEELGYNLMGDPISYSDGYLLSFEKKELENEPVTDSDSEN